MRVDAMEKTEKGINHFLYPGMLFAKNGHYVITTVLGSCVSICLWDTILKVGGMNHYMLPFWNGEGLPSPKYGNVAIPMLVEKMLSIGSRKEDLVVKYFGGGMVLESSNEVLNIGERNITLAKDILKTEKIPIVSHDAGGNTGRKIIFHTGSGDVFVKRLRKNEVPQM